jgi:endonuclease/exonuclease/phosphatase family metal-dependent hydrolase
MRIATYNVEWFANLFDARGRLLEDEERSSRYRISRARQLQALGHVFRRLDADAVMVIEAPDDNRHRRTVPMLETFARRFGLRLSQAAIGFPNDTQQEIAILFDPARLTLAHAPRGPAAAHPGGPAPRFDGQHGVDLDQDGHADLLQFNKPPFEIAATSAAGTAFRMIGVHMKSKAPHGATDAAAIKRAGVASRREHLAQCLWLRERVLEHLAAGESLILMGDFNDGPGLDEYEAQFGRSGVEIVLGWDEPRPTRMYDPHARRALGKKLAAAPATARFYLAESRQYFSALLDYIMVSPDLRAKAPQWRIWHPFDDPECYADDGLRQALLDASDHFPVTLDIDL